MSTVDIITEALKNTDVNQKIEYLQTVINSTKEVLKQLNLNIEDMSGGIADISEVKNTVSSITTTVQELTERIEKLEQSGTVPPDITETLESIKADILKLSARLDSLSHVTDDLKALETRVKALEDSGGTSQGVQDSIKDIYSKIAKINSDILELSTRLDSLSHVSDDLKALETRVSKIEQNQQEPTKSTGVNIAHYFNSNSVGVSANSTAFATFKIETSDDSSPLIQVSANANVSQLGTLVFKVFYDGSEMTFKPKILMTKTTEFITFSIPILEIIKGKIATLSIICETEDASVNFDVNNIAISVIGAKLYKGSTSFSESVPLFSINDTNIMLNSITESVKTSVQKITLVEKTFSESVPLFSINDTNIMLNSITESAETTKPTK